MASMFWPDALWSAAAQHMMTLREIADRLLWYLMKPDFSGHWVHTVRSLMPGASDAYIPAACTEDGCEFAAYVSDRRYFTVEIMKDAQGEWIDLVSGRVFRAKTIRYNGKDVLQIPGRNAGGSDDWLLHMKN